ncbi:hypothetical protein VTO42DRAFT_3945 [Malbranchea cinnamomea]
MECVPRSRLDTANNICITGELGLRGYPKAARLLQRNYDNNCGETAMMATTITVVETATITAGEQGWQLSSVQAARSLSKRPYALLVRVKAAA